MNVKFKSRVQKLNPGLLGFNKLETLQANLGNRCNQQCQHCHLEAGPSGSRIMTRGVIEKTIEFLTCHPHLSLDITGGSPELHPDFRFFVEKAREVVDRLMVRTNLTILTEEGCGWIPEWYRDNRVVVIASLPCYLKENVDNQRGRGVYEKSIRALQLLNRLGYGDSLELDLVYNPGGDFLPASQAVLEADYRRELLRDYGLKFNRLFTITNAPVGRFKHYLAATGHTKQYFRLLTDRFNPDNLSKIMCRTLINVDWQGTLYNCDFNQALGLPIRDDTGRALGVEDISHAARAGTGIVVAEHCYGCTAGAGSSCTGVLTS